MDVKLGRTIKRRTARKLTKKLDRAKKIAMQTINIGSRFITALSMMLFPLQFPAPIYNDTARSSGIDYVETLSGSFSYSEAEAQEGGGCYLGVSNEMCEPWNGETQANCAADCDTCVGVIDGFCDGGAAEYDYNCPADCIEWDCSDGVDNNNDSLVDCADWTYCQYYSPLCAELDCTDGLDNDNDGYTDCADPDCANDPTCACGDSFCDVYSGEDPGTCAADCGHCNNGIVDGLCDRGGDVGPPEDEYGCPLECIEWVCDDTIDNDMDTMPDCSDSDCSLDPGCRGGACNVDYICDVGNGEDSNSCPSDCICGDGVCDAAEDIQSCPGDCGGGSCNFDYICDLGEDPESCPSDCQSGPAPCVCDGGGSPPCASADCVAAEGETCHVLDEVGGQFCVSLCADVPNCRGLPTRNEELICCGGFNEGGVPLRVCFPNDVCTSPYFPLQDYPCNDGLDNENDGLTDCADTLDCAGDPLCLPTSQVLGHKSGKKLSRFTLSNLDNDIDDTMDAVAVACENDGSPGEVYIFWNVIPPDPSAVPISFDTAKADLVLTGITGLLPSNNLLSVQQCDVDVVESGRTSSTLLLGDPLNDRVIHLDVSGLSGLVDVNNIATRTEILGPLGAQFGSVIKVTNDSNTFYIGAPAGGNGAVYAVSNSGTGSGQTIDVTQAPPELQATITGDFNGDAFGASIEIDHDLNGDFTNDLFVGAPLYDGPNPDSGAAYVIPAPFSGSMSASRFATVIYTGDVAGAQLGHSVSVVQNNDKTSTYLGMGASGAAEGEVAVIKEGGEQGVVSVSDLSLYSWIYTGEALGDLLGYSLLLGEGESEVMVMAGAPGADKAYVFLQDINALPAVIPISSLVPFIVIDQTKVLNASEAIGYSIGESQDDMSNKGVVWFSDPLADGDPVAYPGRIDVGAINIIWTYYQTGRGESTRVLCRDTIDNDGDTFADCADLECQVLDTDSDGTNDCAEQCPDDPNKTAPGICGCGVADTDSDNDGTADCNDGCPTDPAKTAPGVCGCGVADTDSDGDGTLDCNDQCPADPAKTAPGVCGCGVADTDSDGDGTLDCNDQCPADPLKTAPGVCGCGTADTDSDNDGTPDCNDACSADPLKTAPGICGCGVADTDSDSDGTPDCNDNCPTDPNKTDPGVCGCGVADTDSDSDGTLDCNDNCATDPNKTEPGICGCGTPDSDSDADGIADCLDECPLDPDNDIDGDGVCGDVDNCPINPNFDQADSDGDGTGNACDSEADDVSCTDGLDNDGDNLIDCAADSDCDVAAACANDDPDLDGLTNAEELAIGTDPRSADTDRDGLPDSEINNLTNPLSADTDGDGVADSIDLCPNISDSQADIDADSLGDNCTSNFITPDATAGSGGAYFYNTPLYQAKVESDGTFTMSTGKMLFSAMPPDIENPVIGIYDALQTARNLPTLAKESAIKIKPVAASVSAVGVDDLSNLTFAIDKDGHQSLSMGQLDVNKNLSYHIGGGGAGAGYVIEFKENYVDMDQTSGDSIVVDLEVTFDDPTCTLDASRLDASGKGKIPVRCGVNQDVVMMITAAKFFAEGEHVANADDFGGVPPEVIDADRDVVDQYLHCRTIAEFGLNVATDPACGLDTQDITGLAISQNAVASNIKVLQEAWGNKSDKATVSWGAPSGMNGPWGYGAAWGNKIGIRVPYTDTLWNSGTSTRVGVAYGIEVIKGRDTNYGLGPDDEIRSKHRLVLGDETKLTLERNKIKFYNDAEYTNLTMDKYALMIKAVGENARFNKGSESNTFLVIGGAELTAVGTEDALNPALDIEFVGGGGGVAIGPGGEVFANDPGLISKPFNATAKTGLYEVNKLKLANIDFTNRTIRIKGANSCIGATGVQFNAGTVDCETGADPYITDMNQQQARTGLSFGGVATHAYGYNPVERKWLYAGASDESLCPDSQGDGSCTPDPRRSKKSQGWANVNIDNLKATGIHAATSAYQDYTLPPGVGLVSTQHRGDTNIGAADIKGYTVLVASGSGPVVSPAGKPRLFTDNDVFPSNKVNVTNLLGQEAELAVHVWGNNETLIKNCDVDDIYQNVFRIADNSAKIETVATTLSKVGVACLSNDGVNCRTRVTDYISPTVVKGGPAHAAALSAGRKSYKKLTIEGCRVGTAHINSIGTSSKTSEIASIDVNNAAICSGSSRFFGVKDCLLKTALLIDKGADSLAGDVIELSLNDNVIAVKWALDNKPITISIDNKYSRKGSMTLTAERNCNLDVSSGTCVNPGDMKIAAAENDTVITNTVEAIYQAGSMEEEPINSGIDSDGDGCPDAIDNDPLTADVDTDGDGIGDNCDPCPNDNPDDTDSDGVCESADICQGFDDNIDTDGDGTPDGCDACASDPNKTAPGICGCGVADTDSDNDGTADCNDNCPADPNKTDPGVCGCGVADTDSDSDGTPDCNDACATDPLKTAPGICGCGVADTDSDNDGTADCNDACPADPLKTAPGICGCGVADTDSDNDGTPDCNDACSADPLKTAPGICGCGVADTDTDNDSVADCNDGCVNDPLKTAPGICGCGVADTDSDSDGTADCNDNCPADALKTEPGICGCGVSDVDSDSDGTADCNDDCPLDPANDIDGDGVCGDVDPCPLDNPDDTDSDGICDTDDSCPLDPNNDVDMDGICGDVDNCPNDANADQSDVDGDLVGDACDVETGSDNSCEDGLDNDGDGTADCDDPDCHDAPTPCSVTLSPPLTQVNAKATAINKANGDMIAVWSAMDGHIYSKELYKDLTEKRATRLVYSNAITPKTAMNRSGTYALASKDVNGGIRYKVIDDNDIVIVAEKQVTTRLSAELQDISIEDNTDKVFITWTDIDTGSGKKKIVYREYNAQGISSYTDEIHYPARDLGKARVSPTKQKNYIIVYESNDDTNADVIDRVNSGLRINSVMVTKALLGERAKAPSVTLVDNGIIAVVHELEDLATARTKLVTKKISDVDDASKTLVLAGREIIASAGLDLVEPRVKSVPTTNNIIVIYSEKDSINNTMTLYRRVIGDSGSGGLTTKRPVTDDQPAPGDLDGDGKVEMNDLAEMVESWLETSGGATTLAANVKPLLELPDEDGDGVIDPYDNCPTIANADQSDLDQDGVGDVCDACPNDLNKTDPGICGCGTADTDSDADGTADCNDNCPADPNKTDPGVCGCGVADTDSDADGTADCNDNCPADPNKTDPGVCGCGVADTDSDSDGTPDCNDGCVMDPAKTAPGICGCGIADTDSDSDGTADCNDNCSADPLKTEPGICGCGVADTDSDSDGTADCNDNCPADPNKTDPGICGCGVADTDSDSDGTADCNDNCPADPAKTDPGICGCGVADTDSDSDGTADCNDLCPADPAKTDPGTCGCGTADTDSDSDGTPDCNDNCAADPNKTDPGICGCGVADTDSDSDGTADCNDACAMDPNKTVPGICGCGTADTDSDSDGTADCNDLCPADPAKTDPGQCGCGALETDTDSDGIADCTDSCVNDPNNDADGDGLCADVDNCPDNANGGQSDADNDGLGDQCDPDTISPEISEGAGLHASMPTMAVRIAGDVLEMRSNGGFGAVLPADIGLHPIETESIGMQVTGIQRLTSGVRINTPADDAPGLSNPVRNSYQSASIDETQNRPTALHWALGANVVVSGVEVTDEAVIETGEDVAFTYKLLLNNCVGCQVDVSRQDALHKGQLAIRNAAGVELYTIMPAVAVANGHFSPGYDDCVPQNDPDLQGTDADPGAIDSFGLNQLIGQLGFGTPACGPQEGGIQLDNAWTVIQDLYKAFESQADSEVMPMVYDSRTNEITVTVSQAFFDRNRDTSDRYGVALTSVVREKTANYGITTNGTLYARYGIHFADVDLTLPTEIVLKNDDAPFSPRLYGTMPNDGRTAEFYDSLQTKTSFGGSGSIFRCTDVCTLTYPDSGNVGFYVAPGHEVYGTDPRCDSSFNFQTNTGQCAPGYQKRSAVKGTPGATIEVINSMSGFSVVDADFDVDNIKYVAGVDPQVTEETLKLAKAGFAATGARTPALAWNVVTNTWEGPRPIDTSSCAVGDFSCWPVVKHQLTTLGVANIKIKNAEMTSLHATSNPNQDLTQPAGSGFDFAQQYGSAELGSGTIDGFAVAVSVSGGVNTNSNGEPLAKADVGAVPVLNLLSTIKNVTMKGGDYGMVVGGHSAVRAKGVVCHDMEYNCFRLLNGGSNIATVSNSGCDSDDGINCKSRLVDFAFPKANGEDAAVKRTGGITTEATLLIEDSFIGSDPAAGLAAPITTGKSLLIPTLVDVDPATGKANYTDNTKKVFGTPMGHLGMPIMRQSDADSLLDSSLANLTIKQSVIRIKSLALIIDDSYSRTAPLDTTILEGNCFANPNGTCEKDPNVFVVAASKGSQEVVSKNAEVIANSVSKAPVSAGIDIDGDAYADHSDSDPTDATLCADTDNDSCDDCSSGTYDPANDGLDADSDGLCDAGDICPNDANNDADGDGVCGDVDGCPNDPNKSAPGQCGCGVADTDSDADGTADCNDGCVNDPAKTDPGICGCGVADTDSDADGTADCNDGCVNDPTKTDPGVCGCGVADTDSDGDGTADCNDACAMDPNKTDPGICGCGVSDADSDGDGTPDCNDNCPSDPDKVDPGQCGCGIPDTDSDGDGAPDCMDNCPNDADKVDPGQCGCGIPDTDSDGDGVVDCLDNCPNDPNPDQADSDGDGIGDACEESEDADGDGIVDTDDACVTLSGPADTTGCPILWGGGTRGELEAEYESTTAGLTAKISGHRVEQESLLDLAMTTALTMTPVRFRTDPLANKMTFILGDTEVFSTTLHGSRFDIEGSRAHVHIGDTLTIGSLPAVQNSGITVKNKIRFDQVTGGEITDGAGSSLFSITGRVDIKHIEDGTGAKTRWLGISGIQPSASYDVTFAAGSGADDYRLAINAQANSLQLLSGTTVLMSEPLPRKIRVTRGSHLEIQLSQALDSATQATLNDLSGFKARKNKVKVRSVSNVKLKANGTDVLTVNKHLALRFEEGEMRLRSRGSQLVSKLVIPLALDTTPARLEIDPANNRLQLYTTGPLGELLSVDKTLAGTRVKLNLSKGRLKIGAKQELDLIEALTLFVNGALPEDELAKFTFTIIPGVRIEAPAADGTDFTFVTAMNADLQYRRKHAGDPITVNLKLKGAEHALLSMQMPHLTGLRQVDLDFINGDFDLLSNGVLLLTRALDGAEIEAEIREGEGEIELPGTLTAAEIAALVADGIEVEVDDDETELEFSLTGASLFLRQQ